MEVSLQRPSSKHQTPNKFQLRMLKSKTERMPFWISGFEFGICLELGAWSLTLPQLLAEHLSIPSQVPAGLCLQCLEAWLPGAVGQLLEQLLRLGVLAGLP